MLSLGKIKQMNDSIGHHQVAYTNRNYWDDNVIPKGTKVNILGPYYNDNNIVECYISDIDYDDLVELLCSEHSWCDICEEEDGICDYCYEEIQDIAYDMQMSMLGKTKYLPINLLSSGYEEKTRIYGRENTKHQLFLINPNEIKDIVPPPKEDGKKKTPLISYFRNLKGAIKRKVAPF